MDFFDWLIVLFSFATALYLMFDGGSPNRDWPPLMPLKGDDEGRLEEVRIIAPRPPRWGGRSV